MAVKKELKTSSPIKVIKSGSIPSSLGKGDLALGKIGGKPALFGSDGNEVLSLSSASEQVLQVRGNAGVEVTKIAMVSNLYGIRFPGVILKGGMADWSDANSANRPAVFSGGADVKNPAALAAALASERNIVTCGADWMTTNNGYTVAFRAVDSNGISLPVCQIGFAWHIFLCGMQNPTVSDGCSIAYTFANGANWWVVVKAKIGTQVKVTDSVSKWVDVIQITDGSPEQIEALGIPEIEVYYASDGESLEFDCAYPSADPQQLYGYLLGNDGMRSIVFNVTLPEVSEPAQPVIPVSEIVMLSEVESDILFRQGSTVNEEFQSKLIDAINSGKTLVGYYLTGTGGYGTYDFARLITGRIQSVGTMNVLTLFFLKESGGNPCFVKVVISGANGYATATEYAAGSAAAATENPFLWPSGVEQNLGNGVYGYRLRKISAQTTGSTLLIPSDGVNNIDILATGGWYYSPCSLYRQSLNNACESSGTSRYPEAYIGNGGGNYKQLYFYVSSAIGSAGFDIWVKYVRVPV